MRGCQAAEHPADSLSATGYLLEDRVGHENVGSCCLHLYFDIKNCTTRCQGSNALMPSGCYPVTRRGAVRFIYMSLPTPSIKGTKNAARRGFVCFFCAAHLNLDVAKIRRISGNSKHSPYLLYYIKIMARYISQDSRRAGAGRCRGTKSGHG